MTIAALPSQPLEEAHRRTVQVQQDLEVASAELGLAHEALDKHVPPEARTGDVAWAIGQNAVVEQKVLDAAQELEEVTELLAEEKAERAKLEAELDRRRLN
jgi:histone H3/H4